MSSGNDPFDGRSEQDLLLVTLHDGRRIEGSYFPLIGRHFVQIPDRTALLGKKVEGPFTPEQVKSVRVLKTRDEILMDLHDRQRGDPVPGSLYRTREGYEARLDRLARAAAAEENAKHRRQIEYQFHDVADEIQLAQTKRNWLLAVAKWMRGSNQEPTKWDLSGGDMTHAMRFQKPRPQDFDPDPKVRRARIPVPEHVAKDPRSTVNMVKALKAHGFHARVSVIGEITFDQAELLVDFPGGKQKGRFALDGKRNPSGEMEWEYWWDGNGSRADQMRQERSLRSEAYQLFRHVVATGREDLKVDGDCSPPTP